MKKKVFRIKTLTTVACCIVMLVGFVLLCFAVYYQQRVVANEEFLSKMVGKSVPRAFYDLVASTRRRIPLFASIGIMLCVVGGFLLFLPRKMIPSFLLLTVILFSTLPIIAYATPETERWLAELTLQQPRNAVGIGGHVYVYDNNLCPTNPNAFVAFRIVLIRVDVVYQRMEWLEAGYFENQSDFWIYGASYISDNYVENDVTKLAGEGKNGEGYLKFAIGETESNKFAAYMFDVPGPGIWLLMEATFTIGGDNLYLAGSESNDQYNSLNGHYADLTFSDGENSYVWQNVEPDADYPYYVSMGSSTNEFFTERDKPTLTISAGYGGTTSPAPGTYTYDYGTTVIVTAHEGWPSPPYKFDYWVLDGATRYENPIMVTMDSDHTLKAYFQYSGGGGGGECPYVSVWDGSNYVLDNSILPTSQLGNGADVEDYYRLESALVRRNGKYSLLISEFEKEHSYIDQVKLLAVDHESDVNIAVAPDGEILTYKDPVAPLSAVDVNGTDRLNQIRYMDGNLSDPTTFFQGTEDDYLLLNFGQVNSEDAKLIVRNDMYCMVKCINVQVMDSNGEWQTVAVIASRTYWAVEGVDLSPYVVEGRELLVRLGWTMPHKLDYVGLDTTKQDDCELHEANLVSATHSTQGDVKGLLQEGDNTHAELIPGQQIQLEFTLPNNSKQARTYILYTKGHWYTIQT